MALWVAWAGGQGGPRVSATRTCWEPLLGAEVGGGEQVYLGCSSFLVFPGVAVTAFFVCVCTLR